MRTKPNPFMELTRRQLWDACQKRVGELQARGVARTASDREAMAESTALLLLALGRAVAPAEYDGGEPERELEHGRIGLVAAFTAKAESATRSLRYDLLARAAELVLGAAGWRWIRETRIDGREVSAIAIESDAGLRQALELLQAERDARG